MKKSKRIAILAIFGFVLTAIIYGIASNANSYYVASEESDFYENEIIRQQSISDSVECAQELEVSIQDTILWR